MIKIKTMQMYGPISTDGLVLLKIVLSSMNPILVQKVDKGNIQVTRTA